MDEITLVAAVLDGSARPRPEVTAQARQRLAERMSAPGLPGAPTAAERAAAGPAVRPAGPGRMRRARVRWSAALIGVAAAGLAGALTVTTLLPGGAGHGTGGPGDRAGSGGPGGLITSEVLPGGVLTGQPAQPFLTALATRVAKASAGTGRYWCLGDITGQLDPIGPGGQELTPAGQGETPSPVSDYRYSVFARQESYDCFEYTKAGGHNTGGWMQDLGARPATAKDAAAWRKDGSPAWHAWYGNHQLIPSQPQARQQTGGKPGLVPSVASLPSDPARLRKVLLAGLSGNPVKFSQPGATRAQIRDLNLFLQARILLLDPLSPAQRAAAYQVLATVPGVHAKPGVADASGRTGTALWFGPRSRPGQIAIVDPRTGKLLADEWLATAPHGVYAPGTLLQYSLWQTPARANQPPAKAKLGQSAAG